MKTTKLKNMFTFLLALILLCTSLPACQSQEEKKDAPSQGEVTVEQMEERTGLPVVSVLVDLPPNDNPGGWGSLASALESLPGYGREFLVQERSLPNRDVERDNMATRLRTEIMAGAGPDVFLCAHAQDGIWVKNIIDEPFFHFPEKAMKNKVFLPLDEYIEKAEYMEWDKFLPVVMEAGRNEEGQMILPMAYRFWLTFFPKDSYDLGDFTLPSSWDEMRHSDNSAVLFAALGRTPMLVGRVMEPGADEPMFSEEELLSYIMEENELYSRYRDNPDIQALQEDETVTNSCLDRTRTVWSSSDEKFLLDDTSPEYYMIPAYNVRGGVTADITAFLAINRNTKRPELSFKIVDYLMRTQLQQRSSFYQERIDGMPVHMELGDKDHSLEDAWYMSNANFQAFSAARNQISEARFSSPVDTAVWNIFGATEEEVKKSVHEQYMLIKMLLAES